MGAVKANPAALRAIRQRSGLTSAQLAALAGVRREVITRLESGRRPGTPAQLTAIAAALKVPVTAIIGGDR